METSFDKVADIKDFDNHKLVTYVYDKSSGLSGYIAIHRGNKKIPAFGATRIWCYPSEKHALYDAVRLSRAMSHKAALAGLNCGGAKAALYVKSNSSIDKTELLKVYAKRVNYLSGNFVTGADVGVSRDDVILMRRYSPYIVGFMVDPVRYTGLGISLALRTCLKEVRGSESFQNISVAIQGVGKVGQEMLKYLYPYTHNIFIADINETALKDVVKRYPGIKVVAPETIHKQNVDVYSPCALSGCLNEKTIGELKCKIVCGGANNQLESIEIAEKLFKKDILYAPDYLVNAGGLISVYDEYEYKNTRVNRVEERVQIIKENMHKVIELSKNSRKNTAEIAGEMASSIFNHYS